MAASTNIAVTDQPFDPDKALSEFRKQNVYAGAIASFTGQVRNNNGADKIISLVLEHYPAFTQRQIADCAEQSIKRFTVTSLTIVHRIGALGPGEPIVFVAAAAAHRRAAFDCVDYLMDYLKTEAPFWKREITSRGQEWIEPHERDYADRARWRGAAMAGDKNARN